MTEYTDFAKEFIFKILYGLTLHTWCKCIYAHKKSIVFLASIFTKPIFAQQHYVQTFHAKLHPNLNADVESTDRN